MSDFSTTNLRVKATERYSFGWADIRVGPVSNSVHLTAPTWWRKMHYNELERAIWESATRCVRWRYCENL